MTQELTLLTQDIVFSEASLGSGGDVAVSGDRKTFTFDLPDDADALILR
eukprot:SAG11_NODE_1307_length_5243_cov_2.389774_7_plen_49_part_00